MIRQSPVTDAAFVFAGYLVVVGGVALYAVTLRRRVAKAAARARAIRAYAAGSDDAEPTVTERRAP